MYLEAALLSAVLVFAAREEFGKEPLAQLGGLRAWLRRAREFLGRLESLLEAVRMVEREYFDGASVLYPEDEAAFVERLEGVKELVAKAEGALEVAGCVGGDGRRPRGRRGGSASLNVEETSDPPREDPRRVAEGLVVFAKVRVLYDMNETAKSERLLDAYLTAEAAT